MSNPAGGRARPLSPHLQIYRWTGTMAMSIAHRITGVALSLGMLILVWWLIAVASGPDAFATVTAFLSSWFGIVLVIAASWALFHHALGGIRHFIWDRGHGLGERSRQAMAIGTLACSLLLTALLWITVLWNGAS